MLTTIFCEIKAFQINNRKIFSRFHRFTAFWNAWSNDGLIFEKGSNNIMHFPCIHSENMTESICKWHLAKILLVGLLSFRNWACLFCGGVRFENKWYFGSFCVCAVKILLNAHMGVNRGGTGDASPQILARGDEVCFVPPRIWTKNDPKEVKFPSGIQDSV